MKQLLTTAIFLYIFNPAFGQLIITGGIPGENHKDKIEFKIDTLRLAGDSVFVTVSKFVNGRLIHREDQINIWRTNGQGRTLDETVFHGQSRQWYENGQIKSEGRFENGRKKGLWRFWDSQGNLTHEIDMNNFRGANDPIIIDSVKIRKEKK